MNVNKLKELNIQTCLDVGANVGQFYNDLIKIYPNCYVEMIEPNGWAANKLKKRFQNVTVHHCGAGSLDSVMPFYVNKIKKFSKGASFLKSYQTVECEIIQTQIRKIDTLFPDRSFDLIKIDTEGFEFEVIKGAETVISKSTFLLIEMAYNAELIEWLRKRSFYAIDTLGEIFSSNKLLDVVFKKNAKNEEIKLDY